MKASALIPGYLLAAGVAAVMLLLPGFPYRPHGPAGWVAFFLLAPPLLMVAEAFARWLWGNRLARRIEQGSSAGRFSWLRLAYVFIVLLAVFVAGQWLPQILAGRVP